MANIFTFSNLARSSLSGSINNTDTSLNVQAGGGAQFPNPATGFQFALTLTDAATGLLKEIVYVTSRTGDTMAAVIRGQEGTTALNWSAGSPCANLWTAGQAAAMLQSGQSQSQASNYALDTGAVNAYVGVYAPVITAKVIGMPLRLKIVNANTGPSTFNDGSGIGNIVLGTGAALAGGELVAGLVAEFMWNGANYELMAPTVNPTSILSGQCYLIPSSTTQIILSPYNGNRVPVQGSLVSIPAAGRAVANTSVTINGTPGGNLAANTDYLVSLNVGGTLEFWTLGTGYAISNTAGNVGVTVISGHDDKTLVGMIGTDGAGLFVTALVLSWFNQKPKSNRTNFTGDQTTASTTPVELSTTIRNTFLTWGNTQVRFSNTGTVQANSSGQRAVTGIGFDGITPEQEAAIYSGMHTSTEGSSVWGTSNFSGTKLLSDGRHYATLLGTATDSAGGGLLATWTGGTSVFTGLVSAPNALTIQVQG